MGRLFRKPTCTACRAPPSQSYTMPGEHAFKSACFIWYIGKSCKISAGLCIAPTANSSSQRSAKILLSPDVIWLSADSTQPLHVDMSIPLA